jgi:endonuclease/exonuclease/phosphatase family metal-dependent hydrolase
LVTAKAKMPASARRTWRALLYECIAPARRLLQGRQPLGWLVRRVAAVMRAPAAPTLRAAPVRLSGQPHEPITIISANLWHDWPRYRRLSDRLEAFACLVEAEGAQVVLLQEVARTSDFQADAWLAQRLGMGYAYFRANGDSKMVGFEEGVAIFSRFPLREPRARSLGSAGRGLVRRVGLGATLDVGSCELLVFSVHLGLGPVGNRRQLNHLRAWVGNLAGDRPAVIGGDFNVGENAKRMATTRLTWLDLFRQRTPHGKASTHEVRWPWGRVARRSRLDYMFLLPGRHPWRVLDARHICSEGIAHSDHKAVLVRMAAA